MKFFDKYEIQQLMLEVGLNNENVKVDYDGQYSNPFCDLLNKALIQKLEIEEKHDKIFKRLKDIDPEFHDLMKEIYEAYKGKS